MLKTLPLIGVLFLCSSTKAQIPAGYYNNAYTGAVPKTCANLKTSLFNIVSTGTNVLPYNSSSTFDTWDAVNSIDTQRNDANTAFIMWDMYTDNPTGAELYSFTPVADQCGSYNAIGSCYNREHSFPQAWFGAVTPMLTDMHHVFATDGASNGKHDNFPYGEVSATAIDWTSPAGAKLGTCSYGGYTGKVFEPIDAYKGDFARAMFYMVTRYQSSMADYQSNSNADEVLDGTTWPSLDNWALKQWYKWHIQDPVSPKEINRNNKVYAFQNNRNPFIDHPEFVKLIWDCTNLLPVNLLDFKATKNSNSILLQWTTNKEANFNKYVVERSTNGKSFYAIGDVKGKNLESYSLTDQNLPDAKTVFYRLKLVDVDGNYNYSKIVSVKLQNTSSGITVFPNPAINAVTIKLQQPLTLNSSLKITDVEGREVMRIAIVNAGQQEIPVKVNQLPAGRYVLTISNNKNLLYQSFVITK